MIQLEIKVLQRVLASESERKAQIVPIKYCITEEMLLNCFVELVKIFQVYKRKTIFKE